MDSDKIAAHLATLTEQGRWTAKHLEAQGKDIKQLRKDLDVFKYKAIGVCIGVGAVFTAVMRLAEAISK